MNHHSKRILLLGGSVLAFGACAVTIAPRIIAWNEASQGALIASQRVAKCLVLNGPIVPNSVPTNGKGGPLPPGTFICDWQGMTGQVNGTGAIDFLRQGQPEAISDALKARGFKP
jgi:hypothetical protein